MMSLANPSSSGKFSFSQVKSGIGISHTSPFVFSVFNHTKKIFPCTKSASIAVTNYAPVLKYSPPTIESFRVEDEKPVEARIDEWMTDSVTDIVQNLTQASLLVNVNTKVDQQGSSRFEFKIEKAIRENWPTMKSKWRSTEIRSPDGVIFVEELLDEESGKEDGCEAEEGETSVWGIVVQGKGVKCGPTCYLLKLVVVWDYFALIFASQQ